MKNYVGVSGFREAITVTKYNGQYHFTWSQDDTGSENYQVNYGVSDSLYGPIDYKYPILQKDVLNNILGTGHHSILYVPERNTYYIAYHRFMTPLGQIREEFGYHREVCLDELKFGDDGLMQKVTPTLTGIGIWTPPHSDNHTYEPPSVNENRTAEAESVRLNVKPSIKLGKKERVKLRAAVYPENVSQAVTWKSTKPAVVSVSDTGVIKAKRTGKAVITATAQNGKNVSCRVTVKKAPKKITIKPKVIKLKKNKKFKLKAKLPKNTASYRMTYKSNKKSVAVISENGKITAKRKGTAIITVQTFNKKKDKVKVIVR